MAIYIVYFIFIVFMWLLSVRQNRREMVNRYLRICLVLLFFIFVLRDFTIGRDIQGYKDAYEMTPDYSFWDFEYIYFENGYLLLNKLFNLVHLPFRAFFVFCYAVILIPLYFFFKNHSKDPLFSLIIYYCYQFFVLDMSALRQSIAMSICLIAYLALQSENRFRFLLFVLIVTVAFTIHRSAILFLVVGYLVLKRETPFVNIILIIAYIVGIWFIMQNDQYLLLMLHDKELTEYEYNDTFRVGYTFVLNMGWLFFMLLTFLTQHSMGKYRLLLVKDLHLMTCACAVMIALSGSTLLRASSYFLIFITIALPEFLSLLGKKTGVEAIGFIKILIIALYFFIFYSTVLKVSQFDIVPYKFAF